MARNLITISESDLGAGIDQQSAENRIQPGFSEDLVNIDPQAEGYLAKRVGYQGAAGYVPVRVARVDTNAVDSEMCLTLDSGVDLSNVTSSPIVVYGKLSQDLLTGGTTGTQNAAYYFPKFTVQDKVMLLASSTSVTIPPDIHGQSGLFIVNAFIQGEDGTNETFLLGGYSISDTTGDLTITYGVAEDTEVYLSYTPIVTTPGSIFTKELLATTGSTIPASEHQLSNFNILTDFFEDTGSSWERVIPDTCEINDSGDVSFTISSSRDIVAVLRRVPFAQRRSLNVTATTDSAEFTEVAGRFLDVQVYVRNAGDLAYEKAIVDSITVDSNSTMTISWSSTSTYSESIIYYTPVSVISNKLCVELDTAPIDGEDLEPQMSIWGLPHSEIYGDNPAFERSGWVNHIDSYRAAGNNRIVCGLGGNLFAEYTLGEAGEEYLLPILYPNIRARVLSQQVLGPAFIGATTPETRTSGNYRFLGGEEGYARGISATYDEGTGYTTYALSCPDLDISSAPAMVGHELTVSQAANRQNNGTFKIVSVDDSTPDQLIIEVVNSNRTNNDYDEAGSWMQVGSFTDTITFNTAHSPFIYGDKLLGSTIPEAELITAVTSDGADTIVAGVYSYLTFEAGQRLVAERTSHVMPIRNELEQETVSNLVRGDMLSVTGLDRKVRVTAINPLDSQAVTIAGDTVSGISDTSVLRIGQRILLTGAGDWDGEQVITEIIDAGSVKIDTELTGSPGSPWLIGKTVDLDESLQYNDTINSQYEVFVGSRWIPLEAPTDNFTNTQNTYINYLSALPPGNQPILKSTMVSDNMYFTNGEDSVMKWDGSALIRAGLPRWNAQMYVTKDTTAASKIVLNLASASSGYNRAAGSPVFEFDEYLTSPFTAGDTITIENSSGTKLTATIAKMWRNTTTGKDYIQVENVLDLESIGTAHPFLFRQTATYKYYFRLNALDNNDNLIASAATGVDDATISLDQDALIRVKLVSFPAWDIYDYDKLEMQVYRTKKNGVAPYYLVQTVPLEFNDSTNYIQIRDAISDSDLRDLDAVSTALEGAELGTQWSQPIRSKYITSAGNRLVLGNVVGDPVIDLQVVKNSRDVEINEADFDGESIIFRKDNTDTETTSDGSNRQRFVFLNSGELTIENMSFDSEHIYVSTTTAHGLAAGNWVYLFHGDEVNARCVQDGGWWQVAEILSSTQFSVDYTNTIAPITTFNAATSVNIANDRITINNDDGSGNLILNVNDQISFDLTTTGSLPSPVVANEPYYVKVATLTYIELTTTPGGAILNLTTTGSGTVGIYNVIRSSRVAVAPDANDFPVWIGYDGNTQTSVGNTPFIQLRAMMRLATAINVHQVSLHQPWMMAEAGNLIGGGRVIISQPKVISTSLEAEISAGLTTNMQIFGNGLLLPRTVDGSPVYSVGAVEYEFPSRILISYPNFPEIFSNPTAAVDSESVSVIDVNSADGQEITGVIPFFGESAFGAAQKSGVVVVFKTNSIYLVDINAKASGINPVQRIESQGLGCSAPHSIANTRDGIMFANESGLYRLGRNMAIEYVGQKVERVWRERVNRNQLDLVFGHHYGIGSQYKVSVPLDGNTSPGDLLVYSHVREYRGGFGAWTRYSNHPAIGWANLFSDAFFATTDGQVMSVRRTGGVSDFRDDSQPISAEVLLRALDFGDSGIRKTVRFLIVKFRVVADTNSTLLYTARDLVENYELNDPFLLNDTRNDLSGLNDPNRVKIKSIKFSPPEKEAVYFQTLIQNGAIDQPLEIVEVSYRVSGMTDAGIEQAINTTND